MTENLQRFWDTGKSSKLITTGRTAIIVKDSRKLSTYHRSSPFDKKTLTTTKAEKLYGQLESRDIIEDKQKDCKRFIIALNTIYR